jgi:O-glycosyl hydrolase
MHPRRRSAALILGVAAVSCAALTTAGLAATAAPKPAASPAPGARPVTWVLTTPDRRQLLATQPATTFGPNQPTYYSWSDIRVDDAKRFQKVQGVGAALTESSAVLLDQLPAATRTQVLTRLFSRTTGAGIGVVRVPFGASDFSLSDYTFDDMPWGRTDPTLARFSIDRDRAHLVPLLTAAQRLNPPLTVVATPWSAPAWMKTNINTHDGQLAPAWEDAYARYLAKAVTAYRAAGAPVRAVTVVNEPSASRGWSPSMPMGAAQQARFVGKHLRPALDAAGLKGFTILGFDHSWNDTAYPTSLLTGPYAGAFTGAAFHCYAGDASAQSRVAAAAPGKQMWTTECSGGTVPRLRDQPAVERAPHAHRAVPELLDRGAVVQPGARSPGRSDQRRLHQLPRRPHRRPRHERRELQRRVLAALTHRAVRQPRRGPRGLHRFELHRRAVRRLPESGRLARAGALQRGRHGAAGDRPLGGQGGAGADPVGGRGHAALVRQGAQAVKGDPATRCRTTSGMTVVGDSESRHSTTAATSSPLIMLSWGTRLWTHEDMSVST